MAQRCPTCGGSGEYHGFFCPMCGGEGVVEDYMMTPAQTGQPNDTQQRADILQKLLAAGVVDISDPVNQYQILNLLASGNYTIEDITDSPDLSPNLKASDNTQTLLVNDGMVKGGRTYAIRSKSQSNILEKKMLGYQLSDASGVHVPVIAPLVMETQNLTDAINIGGRTARWKRFDQLMCTFWSDKARTIKNVVDPRLIQLKIVPRFPNKILQASEIVTQNVPPLPTNLPNPLQPQVLTEVMLYQVDAFHNPTHQLKSDLVITRNPAIYIPRYYELQLTVTIATGVGPPSGDCFIDTMIMQTVLR